MATLLERLVAMLFLCAALVAPASAQQAQGTLVQTIDASQFSPASPDTAGASYLDFSDTVLVSDSEVNEIPSLFTGDNLFEITPLAPRLVTISKAETPVTVSSAP